MSDRTTINVGKTRHSDASDVKDEYEETWGDVLEFYTFYRDEYPAYAVDSPQEVSLADIGESQDQTHSDIDESEIAREVAESIVDKLDLTQEVSVESVTVEQNGGSGINADDVEGIVEGWVERNADRLRKGEI